MATASNKSDTSSLIKPIELGTPTVIQILNARTTVTDEVLSYLQTECDAILECRQCKSLFRSLANFISHKRVYCRGVHRNVTRDAQRLYPSTGVQVVEPTDPDTDKLTSRPTKVTSSARRSIAPNRKARPVRKTTPADLDMIVNKASAALKVAPIEGVSCAVLQGSEADGRSSSISNPSDKTESITTVEPKDGYPNMNLRQRTNKSSFKAEAEATATGDWLDEEDFLDIPITSTNKSRTITSSKARLADSLSKRDDCDVKLMKCLPCDTTFPTAKALNLHMFNKHSKQRKLYPCIYCKNVFTQFWGVTRHLKKFHGLTGDNVDKVREKIRARVYTDPGTDDNPDAQATAANQQGSSDQQQGPQATTSAADRRKKGESSASADPTLSSSCIICSKVFPKTQYLRLHMVACFKKAGLPPPDFQKQQPASSKTTKPILFVCKTCNRAFSSRQNMVQHAVICTKRDKDNTNTKADVKTVSGKKDVSKQSETVVGLSEASKAETTKGNIKEADSKKMASKDGPNKKSAPKESSSKTASIDVDDSIGKVMNNTAVKRSKNELTPVRGKTLASAAVVTGADKTSKKKEDTSSKQTEGEANLSPAKLDADDILMQLSPSSAAKEEELNASPPSSPPTPSSTTSTPTSLALGRTKRNIKPKQFSDGTIRLIEKVPEVVKIQQPDGSQAYKLKDDVIEDGPVTDPSTVDGEQKPGEDIVKARDTKGIRILVQGESVPLLDAEDEAKISRMIDLRKLLCLKCKRQYGSSSNLRRHAVRHLGWRRYKCKLCKFTSYNKSECKSHLRKCHHSEVATLLDGGLAPYIIDLGALLDDSTDDGNARLNLSLPVTADTGRSSPVTRRSKAKSAEAELLKEKPSTSFSNEKPEEEQSSSQPRKNRSRAKRQEGSNELDSIKATTSVSSEVNTAAPSAPSGAANTTRLRGRARKQELNVLADNDMTATAQDENNKRSRPSSRTNLENDSSSGEPVQPKVAKLDKPAEEKPVGGAKHKSKSSSLEGLVSRLKNQPKGGDSTAKPVRKPLSGTEGNAEAKPAAETGVKGEKTVVTELDGSANADN